MTRLNAILAWWIGRSERERWMLGGLGAVLCALVAWYGIWSPLNGWARDAEARQAEAAAAVTEAEAAAQEIARYQRAGARLAGPAAQAVGRSAAAAGIVVSKSEPAAGGGLTVWTQAGPPGPLFAWILSARRDLGLGVRTLEAQKQDGGVQARIAFEGGGA